MISLELPMPVAELSPNSRKKWAKISATKVARYDAQEEARSAKFNWCVANKAQWVPLKEPVTATVTFILKTKRVRDLDNMLSSLKPSWDGFVDAGLLRSDSCWALKLVIQAVHEPESRRGTAIPQKRQARVRIELEGAP